jgi:hypothetical protein
VNTVARRIAANSGLTKREVAHEVDETEAAILGAVLLEHDGFIAKVEFLSAISDPGERAEAARAEARGYVLKAGPYLDVVAELLLLAAGVPPLWRRTQIANRGRSAFWAEDDRPSERRRQRIRDRTQMLVEGATRIARRGAGECIECGDPLGGLYWRGTGRKSRRNYCTRHEGLERLWGPIHAQSMRETFEAATGQHRRRLNRRHGTSLT